MGIPGITVQPVDKGNSEAAVRFLIEWVSDGQAEARRYLADHAEPDGASLVATVGSDVIGYVAIVWKSDFPGFRRRGIPLVHQLAVSGPSDPDVRSGGGPLLEHLAWAPDRSGIEKRRGVAGPSLSSRRRPHDTKPMGVKEGSLRMPANNATTESDGFSAAERAAMKKRAAELRAEGKKGAKKADGLQAVLDGIAEMAPEDRALAERVHVAVTATAPELSPKTWYGMPAYANADDKIVLFFQNAGKFDYRYSTLGFQDAANLDDGDVWPVAYALKKWSPVVEKKVAELVKAAIF
jgi:uncharacterized protein YdhG (YjbR/CyaY superfamily)